MKAGKAERCHDCGSPVHADAGARFKSRRLCEGCEQQFCRTELRQHLADFDAGGIHHREQVNREWKNLDTRLRAWARGLPIMRGPARSL